MDGSGFQEIGDRRPVFGKRDSLPGIRPCKSSITSTTATPGTPWVTTGIRHWTTTPAILETSPGSSEITHCEQERLILIKQGRWGSGNATGTGSWADDPSSLQTGPAVPTGNSITIALMVGMMRWSRIPSG